MVLHNTTLQPEQIFLKSNDYTALFNGSHKSYISFQLKTPIIIPNNIDAYIQLTNFKFTNAFYNVDSTNNVFYYHKDTDKSFTISAGNYKITNLIDYINSALSSDGITATYNSTTFKITFSCATNFYLMVGTNNCLSIIGFTAQTTSNTSTTSDKLIDLSGVKVLYFTFENIGINSNGSNESIINNIMEAINVDVLIGSNQSFTNPSNNKYRLSETTINQINVCIYDQNNNLLNFNDTDWFATLAIIYAYKMEYRQGSQPLIDMNGDGLIDINDIIEQDENI